MGLSSTDAVQEKILPIFSLTNPLKVHIYASTEYLYTYCIIARKLFCSQKLEACVDRQGTAMSTNHKAGPRYEDAALS